MIEYHNHNGSWYYTGDLDVGEFAANLDRYVREFQVGSTYVVEFHDWPDRDSLAEFGSDTTPEGAYRYALGAFFGPLDEEQTPETLAAILDDLRRRMAENEVTR